MSSVYVLVAMKFEVADEEATTDDLFDLLLAKRLDVHCDVAQVMRVTDSGPVLFGTLVNFKTKEISAGQHDPSLKRLNNPRKPAGDPARTSADGQWEDVTPENPEWEDSPFDDL